MPLANLDEAVSAQFADALGRLGAAGVRLTDETVTLLDDMAAVNAKGGLAPPEALSIHRQLLTARGADVDPNVRARIERAGSISAADYVDMAQARARLTRAMDARLADLDALVMPTTPIVAPRMSELATPDTFAPKNGALLRNPALVNFFDLCAISLPLRGSGLPAGLMLVARNGHDARLFRMAAGVERLFA